MTPDRMAIIRVPSIDQVRPAAFVFTDPDGMTWVEPSYRDPVPATTPAVHRVPGQVAAQGEGFDLLDGDRVVATVRPVGTPGQDDADGSCARALADFSDQLVQDGETLDAERARVGELLQL